MRKQTIKLTENEFKNFIKDSVNDILKESSNYQIKKKYINLIYKAIEKPLSRLYRDSGWQNAYNIFDIISDTLGKDQWDVNVWCENGGYWKRAGEFPNYKEFKVQITSTTGIEINGSLKCHSAGTMEDPFDRYDMTLTLW